MAKQTFITITEHNVSEFEQKKFKVTIAKKLQKETEVYARNLSEAHALAKLMYENIDDFNSDKTSVCYYARLAD